LAFDQDPRHQVAATAPIQHAHSRAALTDRFAGLDACRNLKLDPLAVDAGNGDAASKSGRSESDRRFGHQCRPVSPEERVTLHVDEQVKVARRCAAHACLALGGDANARAFIDAGRDIDVELARLERSPFAFAGLAGVGDGLAGTHAARAGALHHEEALLGADLARAAASLTALRRRLPARA